jgi:hypothetical protein
MATTPVQGSYHHMPVILHQDAGQTVQITPGRFCPGCYETRFRVMDEYYRECRNCGRCYFVPSQEQIDAAERRSPITPETSERG